MKMKWMSLVSLMLCLFVPQTVGAQSEVSVEDFSQLTSEIQAAIEAVDTERFLALFGSEADLEAVRQFVADSLRPGVTRVFAKPIFLIPLEEIPEGTGYELTLEIFVESGMTGRLLTWQLKVVQSDDETMEAAPWRIVDQRTTNTVEGLHRLELTENIQYDAANLVIAGEDMTIRMRQGSVFVVETDAGITGLVLRGDGVMTFTPALEAERGQVKIFSGNETLEAEFTEAFVRLNPQLYRSRVSTSALTQRAVNENDRRQAQRVFEEFAPLSFAVDLTGLSTETWWLNPSVGDFISEIRTRRYGTLTYALSENRPEDVTLYDREGARIISLYPSARKRAVQGRYYSDEKTMSYDVLDYDIHASFIPQGVRQESLRARSELRGNLIDGTTRLAVRVTGPTLSTLTLRLADELVVSSVTSAEFGPLIFFRMVGQNTIIIHLPENVPIGAEFTVVVAYSGVLEGQELAENWIGFQRYLFDSAVPFGVSEHRYIYSNASYWYPQSSVSDYATATLELTVPAEYDVLASGEPDEGNPSRAVAAALSERQYSFVTLQPARYLSCIITRFAPSDTPGRQLMLADEVAQSGFARPGVSYDSLALNVESNPRSRDRVGEYYEKSAEILRFYTSLVSDVPYPTFTLALTDSFLPGGHSPAYFAVLNQPMPKPPGMMMSWRTDPVAFSSYPSFFLAHELAHQWWGQAVGWKNYHEQWLSEGLSQYFAALYSLEENGNDVFGDVLSERRQWSIRYSGEGPVYLGNRLGQIENEPRVFRALVYNKGAMVLHMLRRLIGDEAFFNGLRRYYNEMRFQMAGTDDLIRAFETEAERSLEDFFDRWIHESNIPKLHFSYRTEARLSGQQGETDAVLTFQQGDKLFEVPITVTLRYRNGQDMSIVVPVTEQITEIRVPLTGQLRGIDVNEDDAALAEIDR